MGHVAVLSIPPALADYRNEVALAVLAQNRSVRTVLNRVSPSADDRRVGKMELLAGTDTVTCHREGGFSYHLDVSSVFWSSRLAYERQRIAGIVLPGERVLVPFCGVGPFAIPIAARGCRVLGLEKSAQACSWLVRNVRENRVEGRVDIVRADAWNLENLLSPCFDRAVVPAPYGQESILGAVQALVRPGGWIHLYVFKKQVQIEDLISGFQDRGLEVKLYRPCGNVAPRVSRWAFDLRLV